MFLHELSETQKEAFICLAHDIVVSDGELNPGEKIMMAELRREIGLNDAFVPHYIPIEGIEEIFDTRKSRIAIVIALIRLGYADGAFEIEEQFLLKLICKSFDVSNADFIGMENWVRRLINLEKEAHAFM
jgi:uncharacterized tellurite resistance protein B-like protein